MRILIVSNMYPSTKDPVYGTFVESFVKEVSKRNLNGVTDVVVLKGRSQGIINKVFKYIIFYLQSFFKPLICRYDVIYIHFLTYSPVLINFLSRIKDLLLVINVHGGDVLTRSSFAEQLKQFNRPLLRKSKLIVSPSLYFRNILMQEFPELNSSKIIVSPSGGVNTKLFVPKVKDNIDCFNIGYVSRIDEGKGWDIFIKTVVLLKKRGFNVKAEMVGRGSQILELKNMLKEYQMEDDIIYVGAIAYKDLPNIYPHFDLFVFPTQLFESLGLVAIEAMSCGIPVIGNKIGGLQDYIKDGVNGFFVEGQDAKDYCQIIKQYIELTDAERNEMKKQARLTALEYDSEQTFNKLYTQLEKLL